MNCISSVSFSFILNGDVKGKIISERGLRLGDPISSFLFFFFFFCSKGFSYLLENKWREKASYMICGLGEEDFGFSSPVCG